MTTTTAASAPHGLATTRSARAASITAFWALLVRDLVVLRKTIVMVLVRTAMQPVLLIFVFCNVFPKIGQAVGGAGRAAAFSTLLVAGVIGLSVIFTGVQAVALPLVQEFGYTKEIEDRILAPMPVWAVAVEKIVAGAIQAMIAAAFVFPLAALIPSTPVHLHVNVALLLVLTPIACLLGGSLGLAIGTSFDTRQVPLIFSIIVLPLTFLGAVYYPWSTLTPVRWLKYLVLVNPLVYMNEGFRRALTRGVPTMSVPVVLAACTAFTAALAALGIRNFKRRVIT